MADEPKTEADIVHKALELTEDFAKHIGRLTGEGQSHLAGMFNDWVWLKRLENLAKFQPRFEKALGALGVSPGQLQPLPSRLALPMIEGISAEDDPTLHEMWAQLLAKARAVEGIQAGLKTYTELLKTFDPIHAMVLRRLNERQSVDPKEKGRKIAASEVLPLAGAGDEAVFLTLADLVRLGCVSVEYGITSIDMGGMSHGSTVLGVPEISGKTKVGLTLISHRLLELCGSSE